ncbi:antitoxin Xre/MbcA/ParS toxin-binding domain-containing protein [Marinobacter psychrophilus]|nr:antitoxin Xre/MbcA/ParS toxin-binding domain-containing protein [Marinobacter psychrophilus]
MARPEKYTDADYLAWIESQVLVLTQDSQTKMCRLSAFDVMLSMDDTEALNAMKQPDKTLGELQADLVAASQQLFEGDLGAADAWLNRPLRAIGYERPVDCMESAESVRKMLDVIGRLEHGVFN